MIAKFESGYLKTTRHLCRVKPFFEIHFKYWENKLKKELKFNGTSTNKNGFKND